MAAARISHGPRSPCPEDFMRLSARNRLAGTVEKMKECAVLCEVTIRLDVGGFMVAVVTRDSAENFDLRPGKRVEATFKSTETMIGVE